MICGLVLFIIAFWLLGRDRTLLFSSLVLASILEWSAVGPSLLYARAIGNRSRGLLLVILSVCAAIVITGISAHVMSGFGYA